MVGESAEAGDGHAIPLRQPPAWFRFWRGAGLASVLLGAVGWTGCVALKVGRTQEFHHEFVNTATDASPSRATLERARVDLRQRGATAVVSIDADVIEEYPQRRQSKQVTVRRQKRLAFGLFPGAAELVWMPKDALASALTVGRVGYDSFPRYCGYYADRNPGVGAYAVQFLVESVASLGIIPVLGTCESLVVAPFEHWECDSHDFIDAEFWERGVMRGNKRVADASSSPRLRAFAELPEEMRREIGIWTCFDVRSTGTGGGLQFGLAGFHKYLAVSLEIDEPEAVLGVEKRRKKVAVTGPCEVELSIPGLGHSERRLMPAGESSVKFELPGALHDMAIEARVQVREARNPDGGEIPGLTQAAIRDLMGQGSRFDVNLRAAGGEVPGEKALYEIAEIRAAGKGRHLIRVRVADPATRAAVADTVAVEARRLVREDFANRHPSVRVEDIRDWVHGRADAVDPAILVFEGWVFSAHPLSEGWHYDAETGRGEIRVWISEDIPQEESLQWARENIAAIVADKANALTVGGGTLPGVRFRCLWERFANGILSIGFEKEE